MKCTSTGRKCDGYATPSSPAGANQLVHSRASQTLEPSNGPSLYSINASTGEMRALEYFCVKFAPNMGMYFDSDFWTQFVMQASVGEPAVRHAIVAVGVLAKQRESLYPKDGDHVPANVTGFRTLATAAAALVGPSMDDESLLALRNYNMSISHLAQHIAASSSVTNVTLLACILFVCVEFLRGDEEAARRHFQGGMAIMMDLISLPSAADKSLVSTGVTRDIMLPMFNRLEMLSTLFGNEPAWPYPVELPASVPVTFESIGQARDSIIHLMNLSLRFIRNVHFSKFDPAPRSPLALAEQAALLRHLSLWRERFSAYQTKHAAEQTSIEMYASNVLEIGRLVAKMWVSVALTPYECAHDAHMADFEAAVSLAEQLPNIASLHDQSDRYSTAFTLDVEMIGPIHWVSIKCRDPILRRRAVAVQRGTRRREGLWDAQVYAALAEHIIAVEEDGMKEGELPSEKARVQHSMVERLPDAGPPDHLITLHTKPDGVYEETCVTQERIRLFI